MIFVTVGMHTQPFDRLIRRMDELTPLLNREVIMQIGHSRYVPQMASYFRFATGREMENLIERAELVIAHAGVGTLLEVFRYNRPVVAVPRLKRYGEHMNDHQLEFIRAMQSRGLVKGVYNIDKLFDVITEAEKNYRPKIKKGNLEPALRRYVDLLIGERNASKQAQQ